MNATLAAAVLALGFAQTSRPPKAPPPPPKPDHVVWAQSWDAAKREASIRNVPIFILVTADEG